jgi:hypothetical protein
MIALRLMSRVRKGVKKYMYKQIIIVSIMLFIFPCLLYPQDPTSEQLTEPSPVGGFKALQDSMIIPQIISKANLEGAFNAVIIIDAQGNVKQINFTPLFYKNNLTVIDSAFIEMVVKPALMKSNWMPAKVDGKAVECLVEVPFIFYLTHNQRQVYQSYKTEKFVIKEKFELEPIITIREKGFIFIGY